MNDSPAFPCHQENFSDGMSLKQYAAIHLLQPTSGLDWLDNMIRARMRDEIAGRFLAGYLASTGWNVPEDAAKWTHEMADAMMKQREER